ncbi:MAG: hypothetical protein L0219_12300 [Phycisphaerales bacterium]|nr:hypothetical protein [Phycisphaerales bacterium]
MLFGGQSDDRGDGRRAALLQQITLRLSRANDRELAQAARVIAALLSK